jgi:hypothetical protein
MEKIDERKRIVDFGLLKDDEAAALGNLTLAESLLRQLSNEGHDGSIELPVVLQDACERAAWLLYDSYKVLRESMLEFAIKEKESKTAVRQLPDFRMVPPGSKEEAELQRVFEAMRAGLLPDGKAADHEQS